MGRYAEYRLRRGEALYSAVVVRFTGQLHAKQVNATAREIARRSGITDVTAIPILLDGDTGYGDFNNMRRLVQKLEQRDIAGVCIEDKLFPKANSFIQSERQPLEEIGTFCGKIKAGKDSQRDDEFNIIARVEALIAGWGLDEALRDEMSSW